MAKLTSIPRKRRGPSFRGRVMIDTVRGAIRVRKWPKKRGPPKSERQRFWVDWFKQANRLAKYASGLDQVTAIAMTLRSGWYPRDILLKAMRGRLYWMTTPDGWKWYPVAAIGDISETLDVLAQTVGSVLVRAADRWRAPVPGVLDDVLTLKGSPPIPAWAAAGGGGVPFGGALVQSGSNQSIITATFVPLTFSSNVYDTDSLHNPAVNPTRLTVPAGWTKVRLYGGIQWASDSIGRRWIMFYKNGASFPGHAESQYLPRNNAENSNASPPVPCAENDYFELVVRTASSGTDTIQGPQDATYFAIERVT